jgi:hypothetical protein
MKKQFLALPALLLVLATSCKKNNDRPALTKENVAGTYMMTDAKMGANGAEQSVFMSPYYENWDKDDLYKLQLDGTFIHDEGATKEDPSDPQVIETSTWSIPDATHIIIGDETAEVSDFTGSRLTIKYSETINGQIISYISIFTRQ